jgi:hypothetical protein
MPGSDLDIPEIHAGIEHRGNESVTKHMRVYLRPQPGGASEAPQPPGGRVPVHPGTAAVEQDRPAIPQASYPVDGPADRWRQRDLDDFAAFAAHAQHPVAVFFAEVGDVGPGGFEDPQAKQAEHGHQREVVRVGDSRAAVSRASNCRCVNPRVGDSAGTAGRQTCSAGECCRRASRTQVR